ncbi:SAM-dependent methyltransferase [Dongia sedimenti]|uniref:Class I SAM-dependent methyltransferase n=1 Tax=Dongia sedimenti TaxID=3064282 RepID=A0ABU0YH41_9PROT|nr:class I SAM-dependent methyltransferase [Rhodospirillaceae bacterium R-7]
MKRTDFFPNPSITIELMTVVVVVTSAITTMVLWSAATSDNWYLDHINAFIAALMALLSGHRLYLGVKPRLARLAWIAVFVLFLSIAILSPFDGAMDHIETALGIEDLDDLCLWFVLPCALMVALRSERVSALPFQLLLGGFLAQTASTALDLLDDNLMPIGRITIGELVDFSEFVYLQLYFVGLTLFMASLYMKMWPSGAARPSGLARSLAKRGAGLVRYRVWRLRHPDGSHGDYYAERIAQRLDRGQGHATLGLQERKRTADSTRGAGGGDLDIWQRGSGTFQFLRAYGLDPLHKVVDYGCGSLRIGMHFIDHLAPKRYWGVDVTRRFFEDGLRLLDERLVAEKAPRLEVISEPTLQAIQDWRPDWVFSVSVLMHVPPAEIETFLRKITELLAPGARAVILFDRTEQNAQTAPMSWTYSEAFLCEAVRRIDPAFEISFRFFEPAGYVGRKPISRLGMEIIAPDPVR